MLERIIWPAPAHGAPKKTRSKKWLKNLLRSVVVAFTVLIALVRRLFFLFSGDASESSPAYYVQSVFGWTRHASREYFGTLRRPTLR